MAGVGFFYPTIVWQKENNILAGVESSPIPQIQHL
jgi:hypothetical protein